MGTLAPADWFPRYVLACVELLAYRQRGHAGQLAAAAASFRRSLALNPSQTLASGRQDPDLALLRERHPELFQTPKPLSSTNKESQP